MNLAQVREIAEALDALPKDLGDDLRVKAETYLVEQAAEFGPRELGNLGRGVLEYLAPDIADEAEYQRLLAAERRAEAATRLSMRRRGDGSTDIHARVPDHAAGRLRRLPQRLHRTPAPPPARPTDGRLIETPFGPLEPEPRDTADEFANLPIARQRGEAFVALLENIPTSALPRHGGTATTVTVILDYDTLVSGVGVATTSTGEPITAGQARRLACQAGILPVVLGGKSRDPRPRPLRHGCSSRPNARP